jgi:exonuclease SbcD
LSGNHDDAKLLYFAKDFFKRANIHICTDLSDIQKPVIITSQKNESEKAAIYQIPYLEAYSFADLRRQQELYEKATEIIKENHKNNEDCFSIICAHLFAIKSIVNDAERSSVGPAEEVDTTLFEDFDYTALGHIHSYQPCGKKNNIFYSGSPLKFNPDNKDKENKFLLDITLTKNQKPEVKKIPLIAPHKITTIIGSFADYFGKNSKGSLIEPYKNDYIIFICTDDVLPDSPMQNLKTVFPYIKSFRMEEREKGQNNNSAEERIARQNIIEEFESKPENLFNKFLEDINANTKDDDLEKKEKELFLQYIKKEQE